MSATPESNRSTRTSRGALISLLGALTDAEAIAGYSISDLAIATVTLLDGTRVNLTAHRIDDDRMVRRDKMGPRPIVPGNRSSAK